jgi:hypothetical protein
MLFLSDAIDFVTYIIDIVAKKYHSKKGYSDNEEGLDIISCMYISKTNSQNYGDTKVVAPDILLVPWVIENASFCHPVLR